MQQKWHYICVLVDLYNRELIGYSSGPNKDAQSVYQAFTTVKAGLSQPELFHTDRGNEFKNKLIDETLETFHIKRSLSHKGTPYDNAAREAIFKPSKLSMLAGVFFLANKFSILNDLIT